MTWSAGDVHTKHFFYSGTWENSWPIALRYRAEWVIVETRVRYAGDYLAGSDPNTIPPDPKPLIEFHHLVVEQPPEREMLR